MRLLRNRKGIVGPLFAWFVVALQAAPAWAQEFPNRPVRLVVPFAAGGGADITARRLAEKLNRLWGQQVVVDNIGGAAGGLAAANVAKSKPDGYTLFFVTHPILAINPALYDKLPYDPDEFTPVVHMSEIPNILLVNSSLQASKVADLVNLARARPGGFNFGSGGVGTSLHLAGELFKSATGIEMTHVPYKGTAPAFTALLANDIQLLFDSAASALQRLQGGRVRGIAVASTSRLAAAPALPTFEESGVRDFAVTLGYGIVGPGGLPPALVAALNRDINAVLSDAEFRKPLLDGGGSIVGGSPDQWRQFLASERRKWGPIVRKLGIKGE
jgi:tripartite-type tricarboxylate transporter receptor subunit TctC